MSDIDAFRYDGTRAVVVGTARDSSEPRQQLNGALLGTS